MQSHFPAKLSRGIAIPHSAKDPTLAGNGLRTITAANQELRHHNRHIARRDITQISGIKESAHTRNKPVKKKQRDQTTTAGAI